MRPVQFKHDPASKEIPPYNHVEMVAAIPDMERVEEIKQYATWLSLDQQKVPQVHHYELVRTGRHPLRLYPNDWLLENRKGVVIAVGDEKFQKFFARKKELTRHVSTTDKIVRLQKEIDKIKAADHVDNCLVCPHCKGTLHSNRLANRKLWLSILESKLRVQVDKFNSQPL